MKKSSDRRYVCIKWSFVFIKWSLKEWTYGINGSKTAVSGKHRQTPAVSRKTPASSASTLSLQQMLAGSGTCYQSLACTGKQRQTPLSNFENLRLIIIQEKKILSIHRTRVQSSSTSQVTLKVRRWRTNS